MQTWFRSSSRGEKNRNDKNRNKRSNRRSRFDSFAIAAERLEDRVLLAADLAIDNSVVPTGTVVPGELLTYTIHAQNLAAGTTAATGVVVTDTLPAGETFVDATVVGSGTPTIGGSGSTVTATLGTLSPGSTDTITVLALVSATATGTLTNSAAMTNSSGDTDPTPATASNTVSTTAPTNNVSVTKDTVPTNATGTVGAALTYHVTITNNTATAAANVLLIDKLDANETFVSASDTNGDTFTNVGGTITGTVASLAGSGTDTVTVVAIPTTTAGTLGTVTNTATIAVPTGNLSTNVVAAKTSAVTPASTTGANVSVTKDSVPSTATGTVGAPLTYHVTVTNNTTTAAAAVAVVDRLDPNETFVSASDTNGDTFTNVAGTITGTISSLAGSGTDTVTIVAIPTTAAGVAGSVTNTAAIAVPGGNLSTNVVAAKTNSVSAASAGGANVSVAKDSVPSTAVGTVGAPLTYHVTITNNTTTAAAGVMLVDQLDPNEMFVSASDTNGDTFANVGGTITGTIANLAGSGTDTVTIVAVPATAAGVVGSVTNTATIAVPGGNLSTNVVATKTNAVNAASASGANVSVAKDSVPTNAVGAVGSQLTYHVTITNNTTAAAANVQLVDQLDPNETFVSATDTNGDSFSNAGGTITGTITSLAGSGVDTVTIVATPTTAAAGVGHVTNTATIAVPGGNLSTNILATKTNTVTAAATQASVSITKTAPGSGTVGTNLTYTITVVNATGAASAAGVTMTDTLPAGLTFVSGTDSSGGTITNSGSTVTDTIGTLAAGTTDTIQIVATPGSSTAGTTVTNSASVTTTTSNVGTPTTATATTDIASVSTGPTLTITKSASSTGTVGQNLTYTIVVGNTGTGDATGTTFLDTLPIGLTFVSATDSMGGTVTNTGGTLSETIGTLAAGATDTITVVVTPGSSLAGLSVTNTASASATNFNGGLPITASATTAIGSTTITTGVGFLAGVPGDGTPQTFVQNLYRELLGRDPDSAGDSFWVAFVQQHNTSAGHMQAIQGFMNSAEYALHYVTTVYQIFLNRTPDAPGLQYWTQKMGQPGTPGSHSGSSDEKAIVAAILGSDEFYLDAGGTPQGWINALYQDLLGRAPDGSGAAFWAHELSVRGPGDRDGIVRDLLTTPEAAHDLLDTFYPTAGGTANTPLAAPGTTAGTGRDDLSLLTGAGWENLYLQGPYGNNAEGNDAFFNSLAGGGYWDDAQLLMLGTDQFYTNPNRPITS